MHEDPWQDSWTVPAAVTNIVDGDTLDVRADLGFRTYRKARVRLRGVDTAEIYGVSHDSEEYDLGIDHLEFVIDFVDNAPDDEFPFLLQTEQESGKYGRWIGDIQRRSDGVWLTEALTNEYPKVDFHGY